MGGGGGGSCGAIAALADSGSNVARRQISTATSDDKIYAIARCHTRDGRGDAHDPTRFRRADSPSEASSTSGRPMTMFSACGRPATTASSRRARYWLRGESGIGATEHQSRRRNFDEVRGALAELDASAAVDRELASVFGFGVVFPTASGSPAGCSALPNHSFGRRRDAVGPNSRRQRQAAGLRRGAALVAFPGRDRSIIGAHPRLPPSLRSASQPSSLPTRVAPMQSRSRSRGACVFGSPLVDQIRPAASSPMTCAARWRNRCAANSARPKARRFNSWSSTPGALELTDCGGRSPEPRERAREPLGQRRARKGRASRSRGRARPAPRRASPRRRRRR